MTRNLGQTGLPRRRRATDPMRDYDALPEAVRRWLHGAVLPWSPRSCRRIWQRERAKGRSVEDALRVLSRIEARMLLRDADGAGVRDGR